MLILARLKRILRPVRPILLPIWWLVQAAPPMVTGLVRRVIPRLDPLHVPRGIPIRPLREVDYLKMTVKFPYYQGRWGYTSRALAQAAELIRRRGLRTALEMGAPVRSVIVGADVMDVTARPVLDADVSIVVHDATISPWPVSDKAYDLFVALQVFEHLKDRQAEAFLEVRRVARHAILSLPIDWVMDDPRNCHHQISHERVLSWFAPVIPTRVLEGNGGRRRRLIYVFEDLPVPAPAPGSAAVGASVRPPGAAP